AEHTVVVADEGQRIAANISVIGLGLKFIAGADIDGVAERGECGCIAGGDGRKTRRGGVGGTAGGRAAAGPAAVAEIVAQTTVVIAARVEGIFRACAIGGVAAATIAAGGAAVLRIATAVLRTSGGAVATLGAIARRAPGCVRRRRLGRPEPAAVVVFGKLT